VLAQFGIHDVRQLQTFRPQSPADQHKQIAIDLIAEIERRSDGAIKDAFFERLVDSRGAFKRTYANRFADFDRLLIETWRAHALAERPVRILDAAVSDGSTTLSLIDAFAAATDMQYRVQATDLDGRYWVLSDAHRSKRSRVIVTDGGEILQIIVPPFVLGHPRLDRRFRFPANKLVRLWGRRLAQRLIDAWRKGSPDVSVQPLVVANPEFRRRLETDSRVAFNSWNILEPWKGEQHHVVRAMNVLNPTYFTVAEQGTVLRGLPHATVDGGLVALGSNENQNTPVDGGIWQRRGERLRQLASSGKGFRCMDALKPLLA
jgi:chemotaxis methyl-accepting protein methylase